MPPNKMPSHCNNETCPICVLISKNFTMLGIEFTIYPEDDENGLSHFACSVYDDLMRDETISRCVREIGLDAHRDKVGKVGECVMFASPNHELCILRTARNKYRISFHTRKAVAVGDHATDPE